MKKRWVSAFIALVLVFSLTACGTTNTKEDKSSKNEINSISQNGSNQSKNIESKADKFVEPDEAAVKTLTDTSFDLNGNHITLPIKYGDLLNMGFKCKFGEDELYDMVKAGEGYSVSVTIVDNNGNTVIDYIGLINKDRVDKKAIDCELFEVTVCTNNAESFSLPCGFKKQSSFNDLIKCFGNKIEKDNYGYKTTVYMSDMLSSYNVNTYLNEKGYKVSYDFEFSGDGSTCKSVRITAEGIAISEANKLF